MRSGFLRIQYTHFRQRFLLQFSWSLYEGKTNLIKRIAIKSTFILHRQGGAPVTNIKSPLGTAPDLCKNVSVQCYLVATVIHTQALRRQMRVYVHILIIIQRQQYVKINKKSGTAVNDECHTFGSSDLGYIPKRHLWDF